MSYAVQARGAGASSYHRKRHGYCTEGSGSCVKRQGHCSKGSGSGPEGQGSGPEGQGSGPEGQGSGPEGSGSGPFGRRTGRFMRKIERLHRRRAARCLPCGYFIRKSPGYFFFAFFVAAPALAMFPYRLIAAFNFLPWTASCGACGFAIS